jgi:hypothetical protein
MAGTPGCGFELRGGEHVKRAGMATGQMLLDALQIACRELAVDEGV